MVVVRCLLVISLKCSLTDKNLTKICLYFCWQRTRRNTTVDKISVRCFRSAHVRSELQNTLILVTLVNSRQYWVSQRHETPLGGRSWCRNSQSQYNHLDRATQMVITVAAVNLWLNRLAHSRGFVFLNEPAGHFIPRDDLCVFGCVCFGSQEKVKRACPEFIQASELRFPRRPPLPPPGSLPLPPYGFGRLLHKTEDGLCLQRSAIVWKEKRSSHSSRITVFLRVLCPWIVFNVNARRRKKKHKECSVTIKVVIFFSC